MTMIKLNIFAKSIALVSLIAIVGCTSTRSSKSAEGNPEFASIKSAADSGDAAAQYRLAGLYDTSVPANHTEALNWYRKAANQGNVEAQQKLGMLNSEGIGTTKNEQEAIRWYHLAADNGSAAAQARLGIAFASGEGAPQDFRQAYHWLSRAADAGNADAQYALGKLFADGRGVARNFTEAYKWYNLASAQGHLIATQARDSISRRMTKEQVQEGQSRSTSYLLIKGGITNAPTADLP